MNLVYDLSDYLEHPEVEKKVRIITFFDKYGLLPTKDAFQVSRSSIFLWKKKIRDNQGNLRGLIN